MCNVSWGDSLRATSRMFPVDPKALLVSLWVETFFFGLHLILFAFCVLVLLRHKKEGYAVLLATAVVIISFSTTHCVLAFRDSLSRLRVELHDASTECSFSDQIEKHNQFFGLNARSFSYLMNNFFADALVVYRCYSLFGSSQAEYYLLLPALMVLVTTMVGVDGFPCKEAMQLRPAFFAMSLATNLTVTSLAAGRLYWLSRNQEWQIFFIDEPELLRRYRRSFAIIIESGGLYSLTLSVFLILCIGQNPDEGAALIVQSALAQIMGIVPTSIIVIVGLGIEFSCKANTGGINPSSYNNIYISPFSRSNHSHQKRELETSSIMNIV